MPCRISVISARLRNVLCNPTCTYAFAVARAVVRVMRVEFHVGATIKGVQTPDKALQRVGLEERVVLGYAGNVNRKLIVWNMKTDDRQFSFRILDYRSR